MKKANKTKPAAAGVKQTDEQPKTRHPVRGTKRTATSVMSFDQLNFYLHSPVPGIKPSATASPIPASAMSALHDVLKRHLLYRMSSWAHAGSDIAELKRCFVEVQRDMQLLQLAEAFLDWLLKQMTSRLLDR